MRHDRLSTSSRAAWFAVALLVPVALLNYLDRQMLATMKASMVDDIPSIANRADWGLVLGSFKWTYAVLGPIGGYVADRWGDRRVICASLLAWSLVTWWTGQVTTLGELVMARALMGVSEAFYIPAALAFIIAHHSEPTRSRAVGAHQAGIYLGQILGGFAGYAAESPDLGWRTAFSACGLVGIVYALPLTLLLRSPTRSRALEATAVARPGSVALGLLADRNFILLILAFTLPAIAGWVVRDWMPEIIRERFALGQGAAGLLAILSVQLAAIPAVLAGGLLADRWMRHSIRGRIYTSAIGMVLFLPALLGVGHAPTLTIAVIGLVVFGVGWGFFDSNNMPILCQIARPEWRATGYGIMNLVSIACGGCGDWVFGALCDRQVPLGMIFGGFAGVALLSAATVLLIRPNPVATNP